MSHLGASKIKTLIIILLSVLLMICVSVILVPIVIIFYIIATVHFRILKLKYGSQICCPNGMDIAHGIEVPNSDNTAIFFARTKDTITFQRFKEHVMKKFQLNNFPIATRRLRRYQQRYVTIAGYNYYIDNQNFDVDYHFVEITKQDIYKDARYSQDLTSAQSLLNDEDASDDYQLLIDHLSNKYGDVYLHPDKPLWRMFFYKEENCITFLFCFDHVITDGVHFTRFMFEEFTDVPIIQKLPFGRLHYGLFTRFLIKSWAFLKLPMSIANIIFNPGNNPLHGPSLIGKKTRITSKAIILKDLKEIKNLCKCSFNAILFSCTAYAMRCHYRENEARIPKTYVVHPISLQDLRKEIKTKNSHGLMGFVLSTETDNPENDGALERLKIIQQEITSAMTDSSIHALQLSIRLFVPILPIWIAKWLFQVKGVTAVFSNIPGPSHERLHFAGTYIQDMHCTLSDRDPMGMSLVFLGNVDTLRLGLAIDHGLMKSKKEAYNFLENFSKEISNLRRELDLDSKDDGRK